jgi:hypothetical protein
MTYHTTPFFPHRRRKDGTLQSICLKCLATIGIRKSDLELTELDKTHVCSSTSLSDGDEADDTLVIPAKMSLRANISRFGEDDPRYAVHIIAQKNAVYLRKTFGSWSDVEQGIANLHLSEPFANNAASKFALGHVQYGEFVENLKPIEPELLGFQIDA